MEVIENLEQIKVGAWFRVNQKYPHKFGGREEIYIGEVITITEKHLMLKKRFQYNRHGKFEFNVSTLNETMIVPKIPTIIKKKKLKHKKNTHNKDCIFRKLNKKEIQLLMAREMLKALEL